MLNKENCHSVLSTHQHSTYPTSIYQPAMLWWKLSGLYTSTVLQLIATYMYNSTLPVASSHAWHYLIMTLAWHYLTMTLAWLYLTMTLAWHYPAMTLAGDSHFLGEATDIPQYREGSDFRLNITEHGSTLLHYRHHLRQGLWKNHPRLSKVTDHRLSILTTSVPLVVHTQILL